MAITPAAPDTIVETGSRDVSTGSHIREFTDSHLTQAVIDAANEVPEGHRLALVGYFNQAKEAKIAVVAKPGKSWSISGVMDHTPSKGWTGEVGVVWSPF